VDRRRLADIRAGTPGELRSSGSGYLVGQRLVLTCRHVVADGQGRPWPRLEVRLGYPTDGSWLPVAAEVAWVHPDLAVDAALLRIDSDPPAGTGRVRWGWFVGVSPVPYTGLGYPEFADYESGRGVEQLSGMLSPLSVGADGGFVLDQGPAPQAGLRAWPGISGTAVFCQGLLTAVVARDDRAFGNRRLHAVPVSALMTEPGFAGLVADDTGTAPALEAVELAEFLQSPVSAVRARTPGSLLAAAVEAVEFTGRAAELAELAAWRDGGENFSVLLVTGEGGQGKTRLARQFAAQARQAGWAVGFLPARAAATVAGDRNPLQAAMRLAMRVREATRPVLLAADYAETRPEEITALADALGTGPLAQPARMLLLSRTAGAWWDDLAEALGPHAAQHIGLAPLTGAGKARRDAYAAAVTGLARHLAALPDFPAEQQAGQPWSALAEDLAAHPPNVDDPRLGNALSLQITALTSLLAAAAGQAPAAVPGEDDLVRHERGYLRRAAAKRRLFGPGILSDRADDNERAAEAWRALERALAAVILLGPCDTTRARAIGALASEARAEDVMNWLAALYPPPGEGTSIGAVEPDRLAEVFLGPILTRQPGLLAQVGMLVQTLDDGYQLLFTLVRTAARPDFTQIGEQAASLIVTHPAPLAQCAVGLSAVLPRSSPLREGLLRLGYESPEAFRQSVYPALAQLPHVSVSGALLNAALATVVTEVLRTLAQNDPDAYLSDLAVSLNNLGVQMGEAGRREAALAVAQEALETYRRLAKADPDAYLPAQAVVLSNLSNQLAAVGRQDALGLAQEAVTIQRRLAEADPDVHLPALAGFLSNLGVRLAAVGRREDALGLAQEAAETYRRLAEHNPDDYLPYLATALTNLGVARHSG
jgi:tetratricopeptide (TPR) repeat protein